MQAGQCPFVSYTHMTEWRHCQHVTGHSDTVTQSLSPGTVININETEFCLSTLYDSSFFILLSMAINSIYPTI